MAEELNRYFATVLTVEESDSTPELQGSQGTELSVVAVIQKGKLKGRKVDKSPRPDRLQLRVLKELAEEIVEALAMIFQESLESVRVSEDRKMANVIPLFKKGGRQKTGNYRPLSLTSVVDKILESIIKDEIASAWKCMELMSKLDKGEPVDMIYLAFLKAFDKMPYRKLLSSGWTAFGMSEQFGAPYLRMDVLTLEEVQRRFTKIFPGMKDLSFEEWLRILGLYSMEFRRLRRFVTKLDDIISEAPDEVMLFYSAWNLYCLVRY
eukprot:g43588.t1